MSQSPTREVVIRYPLGEIAKAIHKSKWHLGEASKVFVSVSGGADSDIMLDLLLRTKELYPEELSDVELRFVFF